LEKRDSRLFFNRGNVLRFLNKNQEALNDYNEAIILDNNFYDCYINRGNIKLLLNLDPLEDFDHVINSLQESNNDNKINLIDAYFNRANYYREKGEFEKSLSDYNKCLLLNPNDVEVLSNRGNLYNLMKRYKDSLNDFNNAINYENENLERNDVLSELYIKRGEINTNLDLYEISINDFSKSLTLKVNYQAYNYRGISYSKMGKVNEALDDFSKAIKLSNAKNGDIFFNRGVAFYDLKNYKLAVYDFSKSMELKFVPKALLYRGLSLEILGLLKESENDINRAIDIDPTLKKIKL
jgi:tetratricopeptide (TPR) repeat protein